MRIFYGAKALLPLLFCFLVATTGVTSHFNPFFAYVLALALGYLAPDFWLGRRIKQRQTEHSARAPGFPRSNGSVYRGRTKHGSGGLPVYR